MHREALGTFGSLQHMVSRKFMVFLQRKSPTWVREAMKNRDGIQPRGTVWNELEGKPGTSRMGRETRTCRGLEGEGRRNTLGRIPSVSSKVVHRTLGVFRAPPAVCAFLPRGCEGRELTDGRWACQGPGTRTWDDAFQTLLHVTHKTTLGGGWW